ncbi:MAG: TIGR03842 family LLM class F420-dependent oxidoreductase [Anaerolineaceae bacterium]|nr:TIGR03842 family LLM class F420-dependent oxidoreductase [Anaerolineaceae bacterium]MDE0329595.1 TIGR03842 family LLM class F420-dependent oxidoreductase [Anaerolineaceae bacterium]
MEFAITFKGDISPQRTVALCRQAELAGFSYAWFYDSHILWRDPWVTMAMCMEHTDSIRFGPCVTNPGVRDWSVAASMYATLAMLSGGRLDIGLGRGDSSMRVMGKTPKTIARMCEFVHAVKGMVRGDLVRYAEAPEAVQFPWAEGYELPVWIAAYGPRALRAAGEHGDGLVIQLAEPLLCRWFLSQALEAGEAAGRDMSGYRVMAAAPVWVGDVARGREQTRWFPAMVGNHVADIVEKYGSATTEVPDSFTRYIEGRRGYDYQEHASKDAGHLGFITDEVIESFSILGPAEEHVGKLQALQGAGVTQFNIYLMCGEEERIVAEYGEHVIPQFR